MSSGGDLPERRKGQTYGVPARRASIIELLSDAYARDDLDQMEFESRIERAQVASTIEELNALVADFPADLVAGADTPSRAGTSPPVALSREDVDREVARLEGLSVSTRFSLIGDHRIQLRPEEQRAVHAVSVIGDSKIDLRELSGEPGVVLINVVSCIGSTRIVVPRGTQVDVRMTGLIGEQRRIRRGGSLIKRIGQKLGVVDENSDQSSPRPGPTVVVTGFRFIGDTIITEV